MCFRAGTRPSWRRKSLNLLELARHVVLNPVRAGLVSTPGDWPWSSYRAMIGGEPAPDWLETRTIFALFSETEPAAVERYIRFVAGGKGQHSPWQQLKNQVFLGSDRSVESMRRTLPQDRDLREVPQAKRRPIAKPLTQYAHDHPQRNDAIVAAFRGGGYTLRDIGDFFGIHYSRVSRIVQAADAARARGKKGKT